MLHFVVCRFLHALEENACSEEDPDEGKVCVLTVYNYCTDLLSAVCACENVEGLTIYTQV